MSIESSFLEPLGLRFVSGQCDELLLSYNDDPKLGPPSLAHLTATEYVSLGYVSEAVYNDYYSFSFVRDPYARTVSLFKNYNLQRMISFKAFVKKELPRLWEDSYYFVRPQVEYVYNDDGTLMVDFIGKFENLQQDFEKVRNTISHPVAKLGSVNRSKHSHRPLSPYNLKFMMRMLKMKPYLLYNLNPFFSVKQPMGQLYDAESQRMVEQYYEKDFEMFNYTLGISKR